ncbi:NAD-dependent succinate-semialdehyde dehydrogenase [Corynebacterium sp. L4756]|uniref:NAD-dependent succinate-semialdehyde dehydrogenase n=1 Tax=unclassified Corynebacterium TaxID=2624378 RepID=UPI00374D0521
MQQYRTQNPVNDEIIATYDFASDADIQIALDDSASAFKEWSARSFAERAEVMHRVADLMLERRVELAQISSQEMGKRMGEAVGEVKYCASIIKYYADNGEQFAADEEIPTNSPGKAVIRRLPLGTLLGVMPWNFPYYQVARFIAPNLMLGNTALLKHAEICAGSALAIQTLLNDAGVPKGVYINLFATHDQVADIIADSRVKGVSLTGSERAGEIVAAHAGKNLKKSLLELGGNDPYIVLDTDNVAEAASTAWWTRMSNTGQSCTSNKRLIVHEDIYDEFVEELVTLANSMAPGSPDDRDNAKYCPLSSRDAAERLAKQIETASANGATVRAGGVLADVGAYYSPTVLTDIPMDSESFHQEFFGPVASVYKFSTDEEAVAIANDSLFGLGGSVHSTDTQRAQNVAAQIHTGMIAVNATGTAGAEMPFGGVQRSGYGRELGPYGMDEFVNKQLFYVAD